MEVQLPRAVGPVQDGVGDYPLLSLDRFSIGLVCCRLGSQTADYGRSGLEVPELSLEVHHHRGRGQFGMRAQQRLEDGGLLSPFGAG